MYVLGIGPGIKLGHHDTSAVLLCNGKIVAACEEERFLNEKKARARFPINAIKFCLKQGNITIKDVEVVASPLISYEYYNRRLALLFEFHFGYSPTIELHHHHICHAASAYYLSGFDDSLVLTIDYSGDSTSGLIAYGKGSTLEVIKHFDRSNSIGAFYSMITQFLGFEAHNDEYKVMGLASYGQPQYLEKMEKILMEREGEPVFDVSYHRRFSNPEIYTSDFATFQEVSYNEKLKKLLGEDRKPGDKITQRHKDIAASLQKQLELVVQKIIEKSGVVSKNLCFAGGIALNCKLNYEIINTGKHTGFFVQPAAGDSGVSLGAAILSMVNAGVDKFDNANIVYLGPSYDNNEIKHYLDVCKISYKYVSTPELKAAELLAADKIVGWFQGRSEWGPRALGNRSILANPMNPKVKNNINTRIKFREEFRPFAPAVLGEYHERYFTSSFKDPYMTSLADVTEYAKTIIPAVVHCDSTARIQVVDKLKNDQFYKLITEFGNITGEYILLNTSLNVNGQPPAARLSEALKVFFTSGMDSIIMGNYLLQKAR